MNIIAAIEAWWDEHVSHVGKSSAAQLVGDLEAAKGKLLAAVGAAPPAPPAIPVQIITPPKADPTAPE
ncbi:MAG: hypothetical protein KGH75_09945 [Rhodospirillales bacterium]|nr:hypothetical protein [Rhodospirillales bacterium]